MGLEAIQNLGSDRLGWLDRVHQAGQASASPAASASQQLTEITTTGMTISSLGISAGVGQMLSSMGVQNSQMLELMIALLIIMALLEQQRENSSMAALNGLAGSGIAPSDGGAYSSAMVVSTEFTSFSYSQWSVTEVGGAYPSTPGADSSQLDVTA